MGEQITEVIQLIPKEIVTEYVKGVRKASYKLGFSDGSICGFAAGLLLSATLCVVGVGGATAYNYYISKKGDTDNGSKPASRKQ